MGNPSNIKHHIITTVHMGLILLNRGNVLLKQTTRHTNLAKQTWPSKKDKNSQWFSFTRKW